MSAGLKWVEEAWIARCSSDLASICAVSTICAEISPPGPRTQKGAPPGSPSFGTTPQGSYFSSISMDIREVRDAEAIAVSFDSQNINTDDLDATAITIGRNWQVNIRIAGPSHGATGFTNVKVRTNCVNGPNLTSPTGHPVEVLTSGPLALTLADPHNGSVTSYNPFPVPCDITLVGLLWAAQGTVVGGGRADLTDARCGIVGSVNNNADPDD